MKNLNSKLLAIAAALMIVGALLFLLQPGAPDSECVADSAPSSGFVDEGKDCNISIESYEKIADHNSSPKPFRIAGLLFVVVGLGVGVTAVVKRRKDPPPAA